MDEKYPHLFNVGSILNADQVSNGVYSYEILGCYFAPIVTIDPHTDEVVPIKIVNSSFKPSGFNRSMTSFVDFLILQGHFGKNKGFYFEHEGLEDNEYKDLGTSLKKYIHKKSRTDPSSKKEQ